MVIRCSHRNRRNMKAHIFTIKFQNTDFHPSPFLHTHITKMLAYTQIHYRYIKTVHFKAHNNAHLRHWSPGRGFSWVGTEGCCLSTGTTGAEPPHPRCLPLAPGQGLSSPQNPTPSPGPFKCLLSPLRAFRSTFTSLLRTDSKPIWEQPYCFPKP